MSKNTKTLLCSILAIILVAGTMVGVFAEAAASKTSAIADVTAVTDVETTVKTDEVNTEDASETTTIAEPDESTTETETPDYLLGDVDLNGKIEAKDARLALRYSAHLETLTPVQVRIADVIVDGVVFARDARLILRRSANIVPQSALGLAPAESSSTAA